MQGYTLFIETFNKFTASNADELEGILQRFEIKTFSRKSLIVSEGEICREFFFINKGMIRTYVDHDGEEITTWVAFPGTIETCARSFLRQVPSHVNLQAIDDCEVLAMTRDNYYNLMQQHPHFNKFAVHLLENFYLRMEDRFHSYLFLSAEERFIKMRAAYPLHFSKIPLKYLASILRIKPETLSRLRKKLQGRA